MVRLEKTNLTDLNTMQFSTFGNKYLGDCGILQLMDDLGKAVQRDDVIMLGGGNPSHLPAVQEIFRARMERLLDSDADFEKLIGNYSSPEGDNAFIDALADLLRSEYGWDVGPQNIVLTNGSQTAFFFLFNMFAGALCRRIPQEGAAAAGAGVHRL